MSSPHGHLRFVGLVICRLMCTPTACDVVSGQSCLPGKSLSLVLDGHATTEGLQRSCLLVLKTVSSGSCHATFPTVPPAPMECVVVCRVASALFARQPGLSVGSFPVYSNPAALILDVRLHHGFPFYAWKRVMLAATAAASAYARNVVASSFVSYAAPASALRLSLPFVYPSFDTPCTWTPRPLCGCCVSLCFCR